MTFDSGNEFLVTNIEQVIVCMFSVSRIFL